MKRLGYLRSYWIEILMIALSLGLGTWFSMPKSHTQVSTVPDTLRVITLQGATTYFRYKGEELGLQYHLIKNYAQDQGKTVSISIAQDLDAIHRALLNGEADLSITPERLSSELRTGLTNLGPTQANAIVLIQRKRNKTSPSAPYISDISMLLGRDIYVLANSRYEERLRTLSRQLDGPIGIQTQIPDSLSDSDTIRKEDFIDMVSTGRIDYALIDKNLATISNRYYPEVDMTLEVGFVQPLQWVARRGDHALVKSITLWSKSMPQIHEQKNIYRKYLAINKPQEYLLSTSYRGEKEHIVSGKISPFDRLFQDEARRLGWDWEILASIAYQESNFIPDIIGRSGARGLMGIMPRTGQSFGATAEGLLDPQVSIRVSVDCLLAFSKYFKSIDDIEQKCKFTLAAYNAGIAHIQDAQRLAEKYGSNPKRWDGNVEEYIRLKSEPQYYRDPVCKYGYLRGVETYNYVSKVTSRAKMYKSYTQPTTKEPAEQPNS